MPKPKKQKWGGGKGALSEELDAYDYTYDEEYYPPEPKNNTPELPLAQPPEPEKPKEVPKPKEIPKPTPPKPKEPEPEPEPEDAKEIVLEQFDDWEQAMDALDAAISKQDEAKSLASNSKR